MVGYSPWRFSAWTPFQCVLVNARAGKEEEMWDSAHILCKQQKDGSLTIEVLVCHADTFRASSRRRSRSGAWMLAGEENSHEQTQDGSCHGGHPCRIAACVDRKPFNGFETRDEFRKDHCTAKSWPCAIAAQTYGNMRKADWDRSLCRP